MSNKCQAEMYIADNYGDNYSTYYCQFPEKHKGKHKAVFTRKLGALNKESIVCIEWTIDERECQDCNGDGKEHNEDLEPSLKHFPRGEGYQEAWTKYFDALPDCPICKGTGLVTP